MDKEKSIEVLEELSDYIIATWDEEYTDNIDAIEFAINMLKSSEVCGELNINGEKYIISKS